MECHLIGHVAALHRPVRRRQPGKRLAVASMETPFSGLPLVATWQGVYADALPCPRLSLSDDDSGNTSRGVYLCHGVERTTGLRGGQRRSTSRAHWTHVRAGRAVSVPCGTCAATPRRRTTSSSWGCGAAARPCCSLVRTRLRSERTGCRPPGNSGAGAAAQPLPAASGRRVTGAAAVLWRHCARLGPVVRRVLQRPHRQTRRLKELCEQPPTCSSSHTQAGLGFATA